MIINKNIDSISYYLLKPKAKYKYNFLSLIQLINFSIYFLIFTKTTEQNKLKKITEKLCDIKSIFIIFNQILCCCFFFLVFYSWKLNFSSPTEIKIEKMLPYYKSQEYKKQWQQIKEKQHFIWVSFLNGIFQEKNNKQQKMRRKCYIICVGNWTVIFSCRFYMLFQRRGFRKWKFAFKIHL